MASITSAPASRLVRAGIGLIAAVACVPVKADIARSIDASHQTNCAVVDQGEVRCWGSNTYGVLGAGLDQDRILSSAHPVRVVDARGDPLRGIVQVELASSYPGSTPHGCALTGALGEVLCWGRNQDGLLGVGSAFLVPRATPVLRQGQPLRGIVEIAAGLDFICALNGDGEVLCWGRQGPWLGNGDSRIDPTEVHEPAYVSAPDGSGRLNDIVAISAGSAHVCARRFAGQLWCWGSDGEEQLGNGPGRQDSAVPVQVLGPGVAGFFHQVMRFEAGADFNCLIGTVMASGSPTAYCWGNNQYGKLGTGATDQDRIARPTAVRNHAGNLGSAIRIALGSFHACAVVLADFSTTAVYCWGLNSHRQLGRLFDGHSSARAVHVPETETGDGGIGDTRELAVGLLHACVRTGDGAVRCWGARSMGVRGFHEESIESTPLPRPQDRVHRLDGVAGNPDRLFDNGAEHAGRY